MLLRRLLGHNETLAPDGTKSDEFDRSQGDILIYDGLRPSDGKPSTAAPPILQIFHPIFESFTRMINDSDAQLPVTVADLENVREFMSTLSYIQPDNCYRVRKSLAHILDDYISQILTTVLSQWTMITTFRSCVLK